jgi:hypothetical protein
LPGQADSTSKKLYIGKQKGENVEKDVIYLYGTTWEIYARSSELVKRLRASLVKEPGVAIFDSRFNRRGAAFAAAGLSQFWRNFQGENRDEREG